MELQSRSYAALSKELFGSDKNLSQYLKSRHLALIIKGNLPISALTPKFDAFFPISRISLQNFI
jgi:hypothetical protein